MVLRKTGPSTINEPIETPPTRPRTEFRKYTSLAVAIDILQNRQIALLKTSTWDDKNDAHFMAEYKNIMAATNVFASCFAEVKETYHHWRIFSHGTDGVCVEFHKERLLATFEGDARIRKGPVIYKWIDDLRQREHIDPEELPFLKRKPFEPEAEFRVVYVDRGTEEPSAIYELDLKAVKRITLSPWMPASLRGAVAKTLRSIEGCKNLKISRSTLVGNNEWQSMTDKARAIVQQNGSKK